MTTIQAAAPARVTADTSERTITGVATLYGVAADASTGRVLFEEDSLILPDDLGRVKLCLDHDHHQAIGYATEAKTDGNQLIMSFYIPEFPAGDAALAQAAAGLRDGLSIGAYPEPGGATYINGENAYHVTKARVQEVSLVAIPAFADARVTNVNAEAPTQEGALMTDPTPETAEDAQAPKPTQASALEPQAPRVLAGAPRLATVSAAARRVVELAAQGAPLGAIRAALNDVTPAADKGEAFVGRPDWLGELWTARRTDRPLIDSITKKNLPRATKVKGWRWKKRPEVADYTGNKTEISSNEIETEPVEAAVKRIAAGWDTDRIFVDLGDGDMIESLWEGAREDYAIKTEAAVTTGLKTAATKLTGAPTELDKALVVLGSKAAAIGSRLNFVAFGADVWSKFTALTRDQVPWWITNGDRLNLSTATGEVNGLRLFVDPTLAAGDILAGDTRAATFYEEPTPIRVNAIDLPKGGVDLGLFGYHALLVNDPNALFIITAG